MSRVFIDTNAQLAPSMTDLAWGLHEGGVHTIIWSERLLAEVERVAVREQIRSAASAATLHAAIRRGFPEFEVSAQDFEHLVHSMPGTDPDDHYHSAAAIAGGASTVVTGDVAGFPVLPLAELGLCVVKADAYYLELLNQAPDEVIAAVRVVVAGKKRPPRSCREWLGFVKAAGCPDFAEAALQRIGLDGG